MHHCLIVCQLMHWKTHFDSLSSADRYTEVYFDVRDNADAGNSANIDSFKFEGSRALTKAINFQYFYLFLFSSI